MRDLFVVAVIGAAIGLTACGQHETKYSTDSGTVSVSNAGDHVSMTGAHGEKVEIGGVGSSAKLPSYLPLYPGGMVQSSFTGSGKDGVVVFRVHAAPADVVGFYKQKATAAGMAQTLSAEMGATTTYVAANDKSKQTLSISATKGSDGTDVQLAWGAK